MDITQIDSIIAKGDIDALLSIATALQDKPNQKEAVKQYDPATHDIMDKVKRPDKLIKNDKGETEKIVLVARIPLAEQRRIVDIAASFLGIPEYAATPTNELEKRMHEAVIEIMNDNKMEYQFREIVKRTMSETECAELWYAKALAPDEKTSYSDKYKIKLRVLAYGLSDELFPIMDNSGDLITFIRKYIVKDIDASGNVTDVEHVDVYTAENIYYATKTESGWSFRATESITEKSGEVVTRNSLPNPFGKIPIIYHSQKEPEWAGSQTLINRLEEKVSNHADTNDYFDSPIVKAKGEVSGFSNKAESGKVLEMGESADVSYLTWDSLPESKKMEQENLVKFINQYSMSTDISLDSLKGLGSSLSGVALRTFFTQAHLKAAENEAVFGIGVTRRLNYLKHVISILDPTLAPAKSLKIKPVFTYYLPKDTEGEQKLLIDSYKAGVLSLESVLQQSPIVEDWENELTRLTKNKGTGFSEK